MQRAPRVRVAVCLGDNGLRSYSTVRALLALLVSALVLASFSACGGRRVASPETGPWEGIASWYGIEFHGRRAADGSRYNMYELTAAHRTLPFGTRVRVTHLQNGRSVEVRITDRGPFVEGRIIDLSFAAAQALSMVNQGIARVRVEVIG